MSIPSQDIAFAGMKADSGADRVESFHVSAAMGFGLVAIDDSGSVKAGPPGVPRGITLESGTVAGDAYAVDDCASVMTRGLVWAQAGSEDVTEDGDVYVDSDGKVSDDTSTPSLALLQNATFRSGKTVTDSHGTLVCVELDNPFAA